MFDCNSTTSSSEEAVKAVLRTIETHITHFFFFLKYPNKQLLVAMLRMGTEMTVFDSTNLDFKRLFWVSKGRGSTHFSDLFYKSRNQK